ncbi:uncharacterized protein LOC111321114 [Stylophora pistillata]|uniref:uncharacterized protein LOC111321114 n=1 Tax=Stylophora pistillata TaxID=50429 RepID=UPI000C038BC7|nr:uncharacterized protein LOC111321114 [Stylophora pistillata]
MAPGSKKQKKAKSKKSKDSPSGLSRIASTLVPSAIFAAVPRTSSGLSQTWPRRSPSPIAQAVGEAGNVGRVLIGDLSKRPPAELPPIPGKNGDERSTSADQQANEHDRDERIREDWEDDYESVHDSKKFDKTTKYLRMAKEGTLALNAEMEGAIAEDGGDPSQHLYHVLDHDNGEIVEPEYSTVDKRKKSAAKQSADGDKEEKESLSEVSYSSDELTDVTSHDEESTTSGSRVKRSLDFGGRRYSRKGSREESLDGQDIVDAPVSHRKKGSTKRQTPDTIQEVSEDAGEEGNGAAPPPPIPPYLEDTSPKAPERHRRRGQRPALDQLDGPGEPLPPIPGEPPENRLTDEQRRALKVVERLGFEGVSQKLALSDLSEDSESYMTPVVPKNTIDFNEKTTFEREQFNDTLTENNVPVSEATIEEANLSFGQTFSGLDGYEPQEELQSPNEEAQQGKHPSFKAQASKTSKVSSFVHLLNEQERHRQAERSSHSPVKGRRDPSPNQSGGSSNDSQGFVDPVHIQRLEEARQANET